MTQRPHIALLILSLMATSAFATIQNDDFTPIEEGGTVYIDGAKGAKLHLEYTGAPLTAPLKVRVAVDDPGLKLSGATCTVKKPGDVCELTLHLTNTHQKIYGVQHFTVTEVSSVTAHAGQSSTPVEFNPVTFAVGLKEKGAPIPIEWNSLSLYRETGYSSPILLVNATQSDRLYKLGSIYDGKHDAREESKVIALKANSICYADKGSMIYDDPDTRLFFAENSKKDLLIDITDPNNPIYNGVARTFGNDITSCSAFGALCTSGLWGSMSVGLANIGSEDKSHDGHVIKAGEVQVVSDNRWNNASSDNPGSLIYWTHKWAGHGMALLQIQGSTDGSGFDVKKAAPTALQIQSAPPCSNFIKK